MTADATSESEVLPNDEVHVWCVSPDKMHDSGQLARFREMLSVEETARLARFVFGKHQHLYLVSHALVRSMLSAYAPVDSGGWRFVTNRYGKPSVAAPAEFRDLQFNLSHTDGLAACAVVRKSEIGIDVERVNRNIELDIATRYFADTEVAQLHAFPGGEQPVRFFDFWTLKEAYIKARGLGLSLPLKQFAFELQSDGPPLFSAAGQLNDVPESWSFFQHWPTPDHRLAVAVRTGTATAPRFVVRDLLTLP